MNSVFLFDDYKEYVNSWISQRPRRGRGEFKKISEYLGIHSTMISHIFKGEKHLSSDHSFLLSEYLGLSSLESDYFLKLIQRDKVAHFRYKERLNKELQSIIKESQKINERLEDHIQLTKEDKTRFYSSWHYSAIRTYCSTGVVTGAHDLVEKIDLPFEVVNDMIQFLLSKNLLIREGEKLLPGQLKTHIGKDSPELWNHHKNWRIKAMQKHQNISEEELMITAPLSISKEGRKIFQEKLLILIKELGEIVSEEEASECLCLNIDWFEI